MMREFFKNFYITFNNDFDIFLLVLLSVFSIFLIISYLAKVRLIIFLGETALFIQKLLFRVVVIGQLALLVGLVHVYHLNYQIAAEEIRFPENVIANTHWVKSRFPVYLLEGKELHRIDINGKNHQVVAEADSPIREYHFSPNGKFLIIVSARELYVYDQKLKEKKLIESIGDIQFSEDLKGVISGVRWAKDNKKFCYEVFKWSKYASHHDLYVYDIERNKKKAVVSPSRRISSLYWNEESDSLFYLYPEAMDTSKFGYPFEIKVFHVSLETMRPEIVARIPSRKSNPPIDNLRLRNINLYMDSDNFVFGKHRSPKNIYHSEKGPQVGIDKDDHLFYVKNKWFRRRLFKIPREEVSSIASEYQQNGGELTLENINWLPGGRHLIMNHKYLGVLILEPGTKRIGRLSRLQGQNFGWERVPAR